MEKPQISLPVQEWETLIEDFQSNDPSRQLKSLSNHESPLSLLNLALSAISRRDFPLKSLLILFLEEFGHLLIPSPQIHAAQALSSLSETLNSFLQSPIEPIPLKEQFLVAVTSIAIGIDSFNHAQRELGLTVEILLIAINRPNQGPERLIRAAACDCLRELEEAFPCLLSETAGHVYNLCLSEKSHVWQSYVLLLAAIVKNLNFPTVGGILSTSTPLIPFNVKSEKNNSKKNSDLGEESLRDLKKVMALVLERPLGLTVMGIGQLVFMLTRVVELLDAETLVKVKFSGVFFSYNPMLCHVGLALGSRFGFDLGTVRRLVLFSEETQQPLVYRILALHWLLGLASRPPGKRNLLISMVSSFYPCLFDPLALKALKLDVLGFVAAGIDRGEEGEGVGGVSTVKLFEDGVVCVSEFDWLPPWSTETMVFFRTLNNFLVGAVSGSDSEESLLLCMESATFRSLQSILIEMVFEHRGLVPVAVAFLDRFKGGHWIQVLLGDHLLQAFEESLLPKLKLDFRTSAYFPILEQIAENDKIPPRRLLEFLLNYLVFLSKKQGPDSGLRLWSKGSQVLRICRTVMMTHQSSRIFKPLSRLLSFACQCYPDIEVRDSARIYLRMLICIPGKKLRTLMNPGDQPPSVAPQAQTGFFYEDSSLANPSTFIHLQRTTPLHLDQSWSLAIPEINTAGSLYPTRDPPNAMTETKSQAAPRVVDSKAAEILRILRRHFSCIPDFRHMTGLRVKIPCVLTLDEKILGQPALLAVVLTFSSTSKYGPIPCRRVAFLHVTRPSLVALELEPREPAPGLVSVEVRASAADGLMVSGRLEGVPVGIEDFFQKVPLPEELSDSEGVVVYLRELFYALWEACSSASSPSETFSLKGGKGMVAVHGTGSVKLLDGGGQELITAIRCRLQPFIVSIDVNRGQLLLMDRPAEQGEEGVREMDGGDWGVVLVMIFLPPRFHLLFRMEVGERSTMVRIQTDHWPCLAYVDEFLESLL